MTIFGWDASDFDWDRGPMDLASARAAGIDFFTHKATEASSVRHQHYGEALQRARAAGIPFLGAYHVVRSSPSIAAQVDYLLAYADAATPWWRAHPGWFWQCDLEHWSYDQVPAQRGVDFCVELSSRTNRATLLYAPKWAYGDGLGGQAPLWASSYVTGSGSFRSLYPGDGSSRWGAYSGRTPVILQYSSSATIGRQSGCDANAFRGTTADFARLIGATTRNATLEGTDMANAAEINASRNSWAVSQLQDEWQVYPGDVDSSTQTKATNKLAAAIARIDAGVARTVAAITADEQRDNAALAAITALSALIQQGGGNVDTAAIVAAVHAVGDDTHALVTQLQQELAGTRAELIQVRAELEATMSPAERSSVTPPAAA